MVSERYTGFRDSKMLAGTLKDIEESDPSAELVSGLISER
jgi:hypothetical protein